MIQDRDLTDEVVVRKVDVSRGVTLWSEAWGAGRKVLVMGGIGSGTFAKLPLGAGLAKHVRTISYDRRGSGRSSRAPCRDLALADAVRDTVAVLDAHRADEVVVLAACAAAAIGLELLAVAPSRVKGLILHEPMLVDMLPDQAEARRYLAYADLSRRIGPSAAVGRFLAEHDLPYPEPFRRSADQNGHYWLEHEFLPLVTFRPDPDRLRPFRDRILLGVGRTTEQRQLGFARMAEQAAARLGVERVLLPGHHSYYHSNPEEFADAVSALLRW